MEEQESILNRSRRSYVYESGRNNGSRRKIILIVLGIVVLAFLVIIAAVATGGKGEEENITPTPIITEEITPTEEPTPTPEEETPTPSATVKPTTKPTATPTKSTTSTIDTASGLDRASLTIMVQNGGGVPGAASKAKTTLEGLGYTVSGTGNADNFEYENTVIQVKSTKKAYLDLLKKDLAKSYTIGTTSATLTSGSADAIIIVGKN